MRRGLIPGPAGHRHDDPHGQARFPANGRLCRVRADDDSPTHQSRAQACHGAGCEARPTEDRRRDRAEGAKASCEGRGEVEGGEVPWDRDWDGAAYRMGAWLKATTTGSSAGVITERSGGVSNKGNAATRLPGNDERVSVLIFLSSKRETIMKKLSLFAASVSTA